MIKKNLQSELETSYQETLDQFDWLRHEPNGVCVVNVDGECLSMGHIEDPQPIGNLVSVILLSLSSELLGWKSAFDQFGVIPYNDQVDDDGVNHHTMKPYNPLIESGLLTMSDVLLSSYERATLKLIKKKLEAACGRKLNTPNAIQLEPSRLNRIKGISFFLHHYGITDPARNSLGLLLSAMGFGVTLADLAMMGITIVNEGINPKTGKRVFTKEFSQYFQTYVAHCGLSASNHIWPYEIGLPALVDYEGRILALSGTGLSMVAFGCDGSHDDISEWGKELISQLLRRLDLNPLLT